MRTPFRLLWIAIGFSLLCQAGWAQIPLKDVTSVKWWTNRRVIQELRLTPEQQSRIEAVFVQSRRNLVGQKAELDRKQQELGVLLARDTHDEAAMLKAFEEVQQARVNLERTTFLMRLQIKNLLTAEQQPKIEGIAERLRLQKANPAPPQPPARKQ
jgi:Spy/CpxP family protein refolding chaperone